MMMILYAGSPIKVHSAHSLCFKDSAHNCAHGCAHSARTVIAWISPGIMTEIVDADGFFNLFMNRCSVGVRAPSTGLVVCRRMSPSSASALVLGFVGTPYADVNKTRTKSTACEVLHAGEIAQNTTITNYATRTGKGSDLHCTIRYRTYLCKPSKPHIPASGF